MQDRYLVLYTADGVEKSQSANSEVLALEYAFAIIKKHDPPDIRITRDDQTIFSRDQIFDHPLAAGKISLPRISGSWGGKVNLP